MAYRNYQTPLRTVLFFLTPNIVGFFLFILLPVLAAVVMSFFQCNLISVGDFSSWKFIGLGNFKSILGMHIYKGSWVADDPLFWKSLWNTIFLLFRIPLTMLGALILATFLFDQLKRNRVYKTIFFLPTICAGTAVYIVWRWIFNADFGLINYLLERITFNKIHGIPWLVNTHWSKPSFIVMNLWIEIGGMNLLLYLAALNTIPDELYEVAALDGAGWWTRFRNITMPMVSGTTFFILIINLIQGFQQGFQQAHIMTRGGPAGSTTTISYYIYQQVYVWNHMGYGAALAMILFVIVLLLIGLSWCVGNRRVFYSAM